MHRISGTCVWVALLGVALFQSSCGIPQAALTSPNYSGEEHPRQAFPFEVQERETLPRGFEVIGKVRDDCTKYRGWENTDFFCGTGWLKKRMREKVADVGGSLMVGFWCDHTQKTSMKDGKEKVTGDSWKCAARVARLQDDATEAQARLLLPNSVERITLREEGGDLELAVRLEPGRTKKPPTDRTEIEVIEGKAANKDYLAQVGARCLQACPRELVEQGVMRAAARVGATRVLNMNCTEVGEDRWQCDADALD